MARIVVTSPLSTEFFGGREEIEVSAGNVFQLVAALDRMSPGFGEAAGIRVAFAVDGVFAGDWATPLSANSEVLLVPRVGGG